VLLNLLLFILKDSVTRTILILDNLLLKNSPLFLYTFFLVSGDLPSLGLKISIARELSAPGPMASFSTLDGSLVLLFLLPS
jgi:hypothetical protein